MSFESPPDETDTAVVLTAALANDTGCVAATITQIPNEPFVFWVSLGSGEYCKLKQSCVNDPVTAC